MKYRIIQNGTCFRVQRLVERRFLWWSWPYWETWKEIHWDDTIRQDRNFPTIETARVGVKEWKKQTDRWSHTSQFRAVEDIPG